MRRLIFLITIAALMFFVVVANAAQHDYVIENQPGAAFRSDLNGVLSAIVTNNSSATEPATKYANMWWYDTSTGTLKRRSNANDAWIVLGLEAADTDGTLAANSDSKVATQKATKTYVDGKTVAENRLSISDNTTANATTSAHGYLKKLSNVATEFMNGAGNWVAVTIDSILPSQTGNSGKFLTTNGSAASWGALSSNSVLFTNTGANSWTAPTGVTTVFVTMVAGGAGGHGNGGGGGAGAWIIRCAVKVTAGNTYTATVGAGGAGGVYDRGQAGGNSSFVGDDNTITVNGAQREGTGGTATGSYNGSSTSVAGGRVTTAGGNGYTGGYGGAGGGTPFGKGGAQATAGTGYGSGGGGVSNSNNISAVGMQGFVYLEW